VKTIVRFERKDSSEHLNFSALQGKTAKELLDQCLLVEPYSGVVLFEHGQVYVGSNAIKRLHKYVRIPWSWFCKLPISKLYSFIVLIRRRFGTVDPDYCPINQKYKDRLLP
tara:strand:- start:965 stop:1297 length:333 start_codon:yes stop_codon:yes gene_type:complete